MLPIGPRGRARWRSAVDAKSFGAVADGKTIDTAPVNRAIAEAAVAGGGTVRFPPGAYACHSIHLKSHVALNLELGAIVLAAPAFRTKAWLSVAPPPCRMPLGPSQASPKLIPKEWPPPGFGIA